MRKLVHFIIDIPVGRGKESWSLKKGQKNIF